MRSTEGWVSPGGVDIAAIGGSANVGQAFGHVCQPRPGICHRVEGVSLLGCQVVRIVHAVTPEHEQLLADSNGARFKAYRRGTGDLAPCQMERAW